MAFLAGCGLPGFANFVGEVTVFFGAWKAFPAVTVLAVWGALVIGAIYMMRAARDILHGPAPQKFSSLADAGLWRKFPYALLLAALFLFGCFPKLLTNQIVPDVDNKVISSMVSPTVVRANTEKSLAQTTAARVAVRQLPIVNQ
jgi:NADH-quinone oxidoreductase subunit M